MLKLVILLLASLAIGNPGRADDVAVDPESTVEFPQEVAFDGGEAPMRLTLTGVDLRRKYFVDVYWIAHYMQDPPAGDKASVIDTVMMDGQPKQLTMQFARNVKAERIQKALSEGMEKNATQTELDEIAAVVESFAAAVNQDVETNDEFVLRWLPGGHVLASYDEQTVFDVTNPVLARVLWSIWFGSHSVVEPELLVSRVATDS